MHEHGNQLVALCSMAVLTPGLQPLISTESRLRMKGCTLSVQTSFAIRQKSIQQSISTKPALPALHNSLHYADRLCDSFAVSERVFFSAGEGGKQSPFEAEKSDISALFLCGKLIMDERLSKTHVWPFFTR